MQSDFREFLREMLMEQLESDVKGMGEQELKAYSEGLTSKIVGRKSPDKILIDYAVGIVFAHRRLEGAQDDNVKAAALQHILACASVLSSMMKTRPDLFEKLLAEEAARFEQTLWIIGRPGR